MKTATSSKWPRRAALTVPFHLELCDAPQILSLSVYGCIAWLDPGTAPTAHAAEAREHLGRGHGAYRMLPLLLLQLMLQDATSTATCAAPAPAKPTPWGQMLGIPCSCVSDSTDVLTLQRESERVIWQQRLRSMPDKPQTSQCLRAHISAPAEGKLNTPR